MSARPSTGTTPWSLAAGKSNDPIDLTSDGPSPAADNNSKRQRTTTSGRKAAAPPPQGIVVVSLDSDDEEAPAAAAARGSPSAGASSSSADVTGPTPATGVPPVQSPRAAGKRSTPPSSGMAMPSPSQSKPAVISLDSDDEGDDGGAQVPAASAAAAAAIDMAWSCPECSEENDEDSLFCEACGAAAPPRSTDAPAAAAATPTDTAAAVPSPSAPSSEEKAAEKAAEPPLPPAKKAKLLGTAAVPKRGRATERSMVQVEALVTLVRSCQKRGGGLDRAKVDAIRARLEEGADAGRPDNSGTTAVHEALERGEPEVLRLLLTEGAVDRLKLSRDKNGQTPLVSLVRRLANPSYAQRVPEAALVECTRLLLEACPNEQGRSKVDETDKTGGCALHSAAEFGAPLALTRLLLRAYANPSAADKHGATPLHSLAAWAHKTPTAAAMAAALLDAGADEHAVDDNGVTALETAMAASPPAASAVLAALQREPWEHLPKTLEEAATRAKQETKQAAASKAAASKAPSAARTKAEGKAKLKAPAAAVAAAAASGGAAEEQRQRKQAALAAQAERKQAAAKAEREARRVEALEMATCAICADDTSPADNPIIACDADCGVFVHARSCYDIDGALPEGDWFCDVCAAKSDAERAKGPATLPMCALCLEPPADPTAADAPPAQPMIALDPSVHLGGGGHGGGGGQRYVHVICAQLVPPMWIDYDATPRHATVRAGEDRKRLDEMISHKASCAVCKESRGVKISCCKKGAAPPPSVAPQRRRGNKSVGMPKSAHKRPSQGCKTVMHPACVARERLLRIDERDLHAYCEAHVPELAGEREPEVLRRRHVEMREAALQLGGGDGAGLLPLVQSALTPKKLHPSLLELFLHAPPPPSPSSSPSPASSTLLHVLATTPFERFGAVRSATDGLGLVLHVALKASSAAAAAEATEAAEAAAAASEAAAPDAASSSSGAAPASSTAAMLGMLDDVASLDLAAFTDGGGSVGSEETALASTVRDPATDLRVVAAAKQHRLDGRRWLRLCAGCNGCDGGVAGVAGASTSPSPSPSPLGAWLRDALGACEHSPFGAAVAAAAGRTGGQAEQAALLYAESLKESVEAGATPRPPQLPHTLPPPPPDASVLAERPPRVAQLLLLLWARAAHPAAAAHLQLDAAYQAAIAALGCWPGRGDTDVDLSEGSEPQGIWIKGDAAAEVQPWVYISECVPFDDSPAWPMRPKIGCTIAKRGGGRCGGCSNDPRTECHYGCSCAEGVLGGTCGNRRLQCGLPMRLELVRTEGKGWGVKAGELIAKGDFVIEYVGEYISAAEADRRATLSERAAEYQMDIGAARGGGGSNVIIDAYAMRNLAACINFSCDPNLEKRPIWASHGDRRFPRVGFFAKREINQGEELGYRRDENATTVKRRNGATQCRCGAANCSGWI